MESEGRGRWREDRSPLKSMIDLERKTLGRWSQTVLEWDTRDPLQSRGLPPNLRSRDETETKTWGPRRGTCGRVRGPEGYPTSKEHDLNAGKGLSDLSLKRELT